MAKPLNILPVINKKGGVGKTTTAVNVAAGLVRSGRDVLLVDLDGQGSASIALDVNRDDLSPSSADVLADRVPVDEAIRSTDVEGLDLLTGSLDLAQTETILAEQSRSEYRLSEILNSLRSDYDHILIDCEPSASMLALNAIVAADAFLVPVSPSYLDYQGLMSLFEMIHYVRAELGEAAPVLGVVLTRVDPGSDLAETATQQLREYCGGKVFDTKIRSSAMLREAPIMGKDIFRYAPRSDGARDYARLVNEIEERLQRYGNMMSRLEDSGPTDRASGTSPGRNGTNGSEAAGQRLPSTEELKAKLSL